MVACREELAVSTRIKLGFCAQGPGQTLGLSTLSYAKIVNLLGTMSFCPDISYHSQYSFYTMKFSGGFEYMSWWQMTVNFTSKVD